MKNSKRIIIILIIISLLLAITTYGFYNKAKKYKMKLDENQIAYNEEQEQLKKEEDEKKEKDNKYQEFLNENVYDNKIPIGLYTRQNGKLVLTDEIYCSWTMENVFSIFYAVASNEKEIEYNNFQTIFNKYWSKENPNGNYKIGYSIEYSLDNGEKVDKNIMTPEEAASLFSKLQFYLYDDVTDMGQRPYYHMRDYEMTDETIITSVKIVGDKETPEINGPIKLTVFTYNGDEDFDKDTGKYLGNSKFTTKIYRERYK